MTLEDLARQVQELQDQVRVINDINEIKDITYQYWYSVDTQNPARLRDVFAPGEIYIYYDDMPAWRDRDEFVDFYSSLALDPARQENHFGSSPEIKVMGHDNASGNWRLNMFAYNFDTRTVMRITGEYDLEYVRVDGKWKVTSSVFKRHSLFSENISSDGSVTVPDFGGISPDASAHLFGKKEVQAS
jgi:hypothetical protein